MSKREKHGDWLIEIDVLEEDEARRLTHDEAPILTREQEVEWRKQVASEREHGHPAHRHRLDDSELD